MFRLGWTLYIYIYIYLQGNKGDGTFQCRCLYLSRLGHFPLSETLDCLFEIDPIIITAANKWTK